MKYIISLLTFVAALSAVAQRGKDNDYTVTATNTVVNTYANLTANAAVGATSISVNSNAMSGGAFAGNLAAGDLILIIQMQGASMDIDLTIPTDPVWGPGVYTTPNGHTWDGSWPFFAYKWGQITQYNNSGKFEQVEVRGVSGSNTILLQCGLQHNYTSAGRVQIVRIPRFQNLTLNTNTTMVPTLWNGTTGGIVAVEVNGNLILNSNSRISASAYGFRGGVTTGQVGNTGGNTVSANGAGNGDTFLGSNLGAYGGRKGEGIGGNSTDYIALYSEFGRGAPANGGGGGGTQNSGGGGGANVGVGTYTGKGIPNPTYNTAWNLEMAGFGGSTSPGGGRGGYAYSTSNQDANVTGPNNTAWGGNARKVNGGLGGHALVADATRIFMGGGGGAGDQDSGQGGAGGRGGGIAMVTVYGTISGSGIIEADGAVGQKTNPNNQGTSSFPTSNQKKGNDGAGGGGGGGSVYVKNMNAIPATITLSARGGNGGIHDLTICCGASAEATGPGGAGAGGSISLTSGTPSQIVTGGNAGTSNSAHVPEMVVNGATNGGLGISGQAAPTFNITANGATICSGNTANLTASVTGTAPGTVNWYTQQFGGAVIATGASYITPVLTATTTYYVGICPGTFRIPVTVTVNPSPIISGTAVITNAGCTTPGSVTGLTASGGTGTLTYTWNGVSSTGPTLTNAAAGNYILTVTDAAGCSVQSGPHTIVGTGGPTINSTNVLIANEICNGTLGSITGITATGTGLTYSWSPSGGANLNTTSLPQGNYTLTVTDNVGCIATAGPFTVNFVPGPTINATGLIADEFCDQSNGSITGITANGNGLSYSWTNGGGSALDANGLSAGSYTLTVSDINGCIASQGPILIDNIAGPSIDLSNLVLTNENCSQGDGAISGIIVSGGTPAYTIAWTGSASTNLDLASLNAGSFSLTVTDQAGCVDQAGPFDIQNVGGPVINATNVNVVNMACDGTPGAITGISATGTDLAYQWTNGGGTTLDANGLSAGSYSLTVTDGNGCSVSTGPYSITAPNFISIDITNMVLTQTACTSNTGSVSGITYSGGGTGITVSWSNGANTLNLSGLGMGSYTLTVSDDQGCSDQETVEILMNNAPNIDLTGLIVEDGHCSQADGSIAGITVSGGTPAYTYLWNGNNTLNTLDLNTIQGGNYVLVVTDAAGCSDTETIIVNDVAAPQITDQALIVAQPTCTSFGSISGLAVAGEAPFDFVWSGDTLFTLDINLLPPGSYTLTVTDNFACSSVYGPIVLTPPAGPTAAFVYSPAAPNEGDLITFTNTSSGAGPLSSTWTIETETFTTTDAQYAFALEGTYLVVLQVIDVNGCIALTQQVVSIFGELTIPNVITPNGDNVNETFEVQGLKPNTGLVILNRWGNVVFETDNYQNDWNGSDAGGNMLTEGVYTYLLQPENDSPKHGFVHLMR
jgi:gliding motility-associated-like protein